jgi:phage tail protein X
MTAIDTKFCNDNALSCGVIQNVLEKAPGLVFVNGAFRHKYSLVPPSPPPSPHAPPRKPWHFEHPLFTNTTNECDSVCGRSF